MLHRRLALAVVACATLAACGGDSVESDAERFCGEAVAQREMIVAPPLGGEAELEATLEFYRLMGRLAPVAIAEEWNDLVIALETASTVVPGDPDSEQRVAVQAYATEPSAVQVMEWLRANCGVDIPITTIAPHGVDPAPVTTLAPGGATGADDGSADEPAG